MAFALIPAMPFSPGVSPVPAAVLNTWRTFFPSCLDADQGGNYANTVLIRFTAGSAGWEFDAPVTIGAGGSLSMVSGTELSINGFLDIESGAVQRIRDGGTLTVFDGGAVGIDNGATWTLQGDGTITATGTLAVNFTGKIDIGQDGALRHLNSGTISHASGSVETHANGSTDTYSSGSTTTWNSGATVSDGSTRTRTGPETRSGAGAYTVDRSPAFGPDANTNIDAKARSVTRVPALTATRTWVLLNPGFAGYIEHTIVRQTAAGASNNLAILDADASTVIGSIEAENDRFKMIRYGWDGGGWFPVASADDDAVPWVEV